ncbi:MAG: PHP domain-containing protein [Oscillospiraceae bacterium]|jgi:predicted metal-dependent phosphoesterase TrpH|nr:PHP domain-containing protein [Oscillospiraceae bacterium]
MLIDLHLHSTASDGVLAPAALVAQAAGLGAALVALTDHDSVDGIPQARNAADAAGVALIPGVELGTEGGEVHLLGYGLDAEAPALTAFFADLQAQRRQRASAILSKLDALGLHLDELAVAARAEHSLSRTHVAQALVAQGAVTSIKEAFERFLKPGRPAYVPRPPLPMARAIRILREAGAAPVLAHPGLLPLHEQQVYRRALIWRDEGLMGIEAYHPGHTPAQAHGFAQFARVNGLLVTGGSDFHGPSVRSVRIGDGMRGWDQKQADATALWRAARHTVGVWLPLS